jgi:hypothetical protein
MDGRRTAGFQPQLRMRVSLRPELSRHCLQRRRRPTHQQLVQSISFCNPPSAPRIRGREGAVDREGGRRCFGRTTPQGTLVHTHSHSYRYYRNLLLARYLLMVVLLLRQVRHPRCMHPEQDYALDVGLRCNIPVFQRWIVFADRVASSRGRDVVLKRALVTHTTALAGEPSEPMRD